MALFDVPVHDGYKILTHPAGARFATNGYGQVGNELAPKHSINPQAVKASSIYNKNISGISEAGYGRTFPYYGLSAYRGAGSPRHSLTAYAGAGSPRKSVLSAYAGAGSPRHSLTAYAGAGSPRRTVLSDAYVNDNPRPGTLRVRPRLSGLARVGIPGRPSNRGRLSGLADDTSTTVDTGSDYNLYMPGDVSASVTNPATTPSTSFFGTVGNDVASIFGGLFTSAAQATASGGSSAITKAIQGTLTPVVKPATITSTLAAHPTIMGISTTTLLLGGGLAAYFYFKKK